MAQRGRPAIPAELRHSVEFKVKMRPADARRFRALARTKGQVPAVLLRDLARSLIERDANR